VDTNALEATVRHVLPVLNLEPGQFQLDLGFVARAQRSGKPRAVSLNTIEAQLVFMGTRETSDPDEVAATIGAEALAFLPSREICDRLVVAWTDFQDRFYSVAFTVSLGSDALTLLGVSWSAPETWNEPMINASRSPRDARDDALLRVKDAVRNRNTDQLDRACRLVDIALSRVGAEGQSTSLPAEGDSGESWSMWMDRYTRSIRDEWNRVIGDDRINRPRTAELAKPGPLTGLRVFISYARPDATTLAWPVRDALRSCGASVWFDHEQIPNEVELRLGLADMIASCDAYVLCASDEFFERAGYATQELVWAMQRCESGGKPASFLVVTRSDVVLPSTVLGWPQLELRDRPFEALAPDLVSLLGSTARTIQRISLGDRLSPAKPPLSNPPDSHAMWLRAQHVRCFDELDVETIARLATREVEDKRAIEIRQRLLRLGEGLDWSGTLQDIDEWPHDPLVRDTRLRMASARTIAGTRWPLSGKIDKGPFVEEDVEYLATHRLPLIDWPVAVGWDDCERRLALRYQAGLLRILQGLLRRGLFCGILSVPSSAIDIWEEQLTARRTECYDAILSLRSSGLVTWHREPATWDTFFRCWSKLLAHQLWRDPVPSAIRQLLIANVTEVAAAAAETGWYASRYGGFAKQTFSLRELDKPSMIEVYASASDPSKSREDENDIRLGLVGGAADAELRLTWATGESFAPAPDRLRSVFHSS
jgi:hypothetical protein